MAETFRYVCEEEARCLFSSITAKTAPRTVADAKPKFSGTFGIGKKDFDAIVPLMVSAIKSETGNFTDPTDYYLACMSGTTAAKRCLQKAELDCQDPKLSADDRFKIKEKAEKRAELYRQFPGILTASSQYDVELAKLEGGKIVDIGDGEAARAQAGKDLFYPGAWVVPSVAFKGFRRKTLDAKDGCTSYLQNCLYIRKGERIAGGSGPDNNEVFGKFAGYTPDDPTALAPSGAGVSDDPAF